ncbi:MAG: hypothetical protein Q9170_003127 [Blastenia crenularia]
MGRDLDSQWVNLLALNRRSNPPAVKPKPSPNIADSKHLRSRSSATNYFALLSASEDGSNGSRSLANPKNHGNVPTSAMRDMDSSWVAWFTERWQERQLGDLPDGMMQEQAHASEQQPFLDINKTLAPSEPQQMQMHKYSLPQDLEDTMTFNNTVTPTPSAISSSGGTTSSIPSPSNNLCDFDIDSLDTFTELLSNFCTASPFDPTTTQADGTAGTGVTAGLSDEDFTWLEGQQPHPPTMNDESGKSSPSSKRNRDEYAGDHMNDGQAQLGVLTNKKQRMLCPGTNCFDMSMMRYYSSS